jgi:hypothetical protein
MRVLGTIALVAVAVGAICLSNTQPVRAEQISIKHRITITTRVASNLYLIVDSNNQIKEIYSNSNEQPQVVTAMYDHLGGPVVTIDKNINNQYESLKPQLSYFYGTIYKQDQVVHAANKTSNQNLSQDNFVTALQNIGIHI